MDKKDRGQKETEKELRKIEERINKEYSQAIKGIEEELTDYLRRFELKDKKWQEWVENGTKTEQEYEQWRIGQMAVGKRWSDQKDVIAEELFKVNEEAKATYKSSASEIFAENANYATYQLEKDAHIDTGFTLYSKESVDRLIREDPEVLPPVGRKVAKEIAEGKAVRWNRQQLQSVMIQGILQGDSIPKLATRLATTVGDKNRKAAIRNARTMATAAQNSGRVNAYKRAESKGVEMEQMWLATMDNRTRHTHRWLDRETRPVGEAFSNGCEYPGDPKGDPAEIYNCRCSLRGVVKGLERRSGQFRDDSKIDGMTYDEWRNAKPKSQDIQHQEKVGKAMKQKYINEYRGYIGDNAKASTPQENTDAIAQPIMRDNATKTKDALVQSYTYHQEHNNLTLTPLSEIEEQYSPIKVNYGKLSEETSRSFTNTITRLSAEYDTPLQSIRTMTFDELHTDNGELCFARVSHDYRMDSAEMTINPIKCKDQEKLTSRLKELRESGYIPKIKEGTESEYIPTHEFAHTLFDTMTELEKGKNWAGVDQQRIKDIRKESETLYKGYLSDLEKTENKWKEAETKALMTFDEKDAEAARALFEEYTNKKISTYSLENADEFMAEAFAQSKLGETKSEYTERAMEIIDKYFKR